MKPRRDLYGDKLRIAQAVRGAAAFSCSIFADRRYMTFYFRSLDEARMFRPHLERAAHNGRKALVHAVDDSRVTQLITDDFKMENENAESNHLD